MAAVYVLPDDTPWQVTETAREVVVLIEEAQGPFIELHLGNQDEWNGKAVFVRASGIHSISPPKNMDDEDDQ